MLIFKHLHVSAGKQVCTVLQICQLLRALIIIYIWHLYISVEKFMYYINYIPSNKFSDPIQIFQDQPESDMIFLSKILHNTKFNPKFKTLHDIIFKFLLDFESCQIFTTPNRGQRTRFWAVLGPKTHGRPWKTEGRKQILILCLIIN